MLYDMHCPVGPPLTPHHGDPLATPWEMLTAPHSAMQPLTLMSFKRFITFPLQQLLTVSKLEHLFDSGMRSRKNPIIKGTPKQTVCIRRCGAGPPQQGMAMVEGEGGRHAARIGFAMKAGIANHCCSAELKGEMLPGKTNPKGECRARGLHLTPSWLLLLLEKLKSHPGSPGMSIPHGVTWGSPTACLYLQQNQPGLENRRIWGGITPKQPPSMPASKHRARL